MLQEYVGGESERCVMIGVEEGRGTKINQQEVVQGRGKNQGWMSKGSSSTEWKSREQVDEIQSFAVI